ncbi:MAG: hypothetical protein H0W36_12125 [Gemmatimonadetes bacterium]|nr:hypothetical protein [Gemmatimonadota bacterium]
MPGTRTTTRRPGEIRDALVAYLGSVDGDASVREIYAALEARFGEPVKPSSVRSALNFGVGDLYARTGRGRYRLRRRA